mmetsp:Transcript_40744/g.39341  ORF Transcript_40744/g.39341 Transcript_40744/m.39341 type:complete len:96 (+) Transcript_40744:113-400(+)
MKFQMRRLMNSFSNVIEFIFLDGAFDSSESYDQILIDKGFKAPFKTWMTSGEKNKSLVFKQGSFMSHCYGNEEASAKIVNAMKEHGPIDGIFAFS